MLAIADSLGFDVRHAPDLGGPVGFLVRSTKTIFVLETLDAGEQALTIGHEIAHAFNDELRAFSIRGPLLEYQLDAVAAAVLMPRGDAEIARMRGLDLDTVMHLFAPIPASWAALRATAWVPW